MRPPLLTEVLHACAGRIKLDVELKEDGYVPEVMAALKAISDPGEFVVTSFLPSAVGAAKIAFPEVKTGLLIGGSARWAGLPTSLRELFPVGLAGRSAPTTSRRTTPSTSSAPSAGPPRRDCRACCGR